MLQSNGTGKQAFIASLVTSDKTDVRLGLLGRDEGNFILVKGTMRREAPEHQSPVHPVPYEVNYANESHRLASGC